MIEDIIILLLLVGGWLSLLIAGGALIETFIWFSKRKER